MIVVQRLHGFDESTMKEVVQSTTRSPIDYTVLDESTMIVVQSTTTVLDESTMIVVQSTTRF
ncbi:hypothetical protein BLOT_013657 [Blomia tropicalis]|nr:hypothetical protein BLOT_013657 [Blomia tropicalis]